MDVLLAMGYLHLNAIFLIDVLCKVLCRIYGTVLAARTAEAKHQRGKATLHVTFYVVVGKLIDGLQELNNLTVILKEADNGLVKTRQLLVGLITTGVVRTPAIEDITTAITAWILRYALSVREAIDMNDQRTLAVIL